MCCSLESIDENMIVLVRCLDEIRDIDHNSIYQDLLVTDQNSLAMSSWNDSSFEYKVV